MLVASLSNREIRRAIDIERTTARVVPVVRLPYAGLVAALAIAVAILASALFSRWIRRLAARLQADLEAHAQALEQTTGELHWPARFQSSGRASSPTPSGGILAVNPAFTGDQRLPGRRG